MSQKGMESFPPESRDWQELGNQWVGCQGVCLDPATGDPTTRGSHWIPQDLTLSPAVQTNALPSTRPILMLETSSEFKKTSFSLKKPLNTSPGSFPFPFTTTFRRGCKARRFPMTLANQKLKPYEKGACVSLYRLLTTWNGMSFPLSLPTNP